MLTLTAFVDNATAIGEFGGTEINDSLSDNHSTRAGNGLNKPDCRRIVYCTIAEQLLKLVG